MLQGLDQGRACAASGSSAAACASRSPSSNPFSASADWRGITFGTYKSAGSGPGDPVARRDPDGGLPTRAEPGAQGRQAPGVRAEPPRSTSTTSWRMHAPYVTANVNLWPRTGRPVRQSGPPGGADRAAARVAPAGGRRRRGPLGRPAPTATPRVLKFACQSGARFANASQADLAALRNGLRPGLCQAWSRTPRRRRSSSGSRR